MRREKLQFKNSRGYALQAQLDSPDFQAAHNTVLFAHCFTCGKNLKAVDALSEALCTEGFAVFRFDFTGIARSEGAFHESDFASNISDLQDAATYLSENKQAPTVLVGHSLGGAAVLFAAAEIISVNAVATIAAPFEPAHVLNLISKDVLEIQENEWVEVTIGGRYFKINKNFIDQLNANNAKETITELKKPLLVMHSPADEIVGIENARCIYDAAWHPKSFVSLDQADHLLNNASDAKYAGLVLANWAKRYVNIPKKELIELQGTASAINYFEQLHTPTAVGNHQMTCDEPIKLGGNDFGPAPHELLSASLASCTAMTLNLYANRKDWNYGKVRVDVAYHSANKDNGNPERFERKISLPKDLDQKKKERLLEIANKCPVHKTLAAQIEINTELK